MRKFLVALLILSVTGGVFAQEGSWNVSGSAEISTTVDFVDNVFDGKADVWSRGSGEGSVTVEYVRGGFTGEIGFTTDTAISLSGSYEGEDYAFKAAGELAFDGVDSTGYIGPALTDLWGYYQFFNGLIHVEAVYAAGRDHTFWGSNDAAFQYWDTSEKDFPRYRAGSRVADYYEPPSFGQDGIWSNIDGADDVFIIDVALGNLFGIPLNIGLMAPNLFGSITDYGTSHGPWDNRAWDTLAINEAGGRHRSTNPENRFLHLGDNTAKRMVFGASTELFGIGAAMQYSVANNALYIGAQYNQINNFEIGLSWIGELPSKSLWRQRERFGVNTPSEWLDQNQGSSEIEVHSTQAFNNIFGLSVAFENSLVGAKVTAATYIWGRMGGRFQPDPTGPWTDDQEFERMNIGPAFYVGPEFHFIAIPNYLRLTLGADFYVTPFHWFDEEFPTANLDRQRYTRTNWSATAGLHYNFLGTGAGDEIGDIGTGIGIVYTIAQETDSRSYVHIGRITNNYTNELTFTFKWSF